MDVEVVKHEGNRGYGLLLCLFSISVRASTLILRLLLMQMVKMTPDTYYPSLNTSRVVGALKVSLLRI